MKEYLFNNVKEFSYADISLWIAIILFLVFVFSCLYFKKKRERFNIPLENRKRILLHSKIGLILSLVNLIYVVGRILKIEFVSYRIIGWGSLVLILLNLLVLGIKLLTLKNKGKKTTTQKGSSYGNYLPKKRRK